MTQSINHSTLLSIKQFSDITGIPESTLRYYDTIGLFKPMERGRNNYRYYVPYQIIPLNFINVLASVNVRLSYVKDLVKERTPEEVSHLMDEQEKYFIEQINKINETRLILRTFKENIKAGLNADTNSVTMQKRALRRIALGDRNEWGEDSQFYAPFVKFIKRMDEKGANNIYPAGGYFENFKEFSDLLSKPNRFFLADPNGEQCIPSGNYIIAYARGYYGQTDKAEERIASYAAKHGIEPKGPVYVQYLIDEISTADRNAYVAEIAVKVTEA